MRAASCLRFEIDRAVQHAGEALDDRQTESQSARNFCALIQTMEFDKYVAPPGSRTADSGVVNVNPQLLAAPAASDKNAPLRRILDGVGNKVLDQSPQQTTIGSHHQPAWHESKVQSLGGGERGELHLDLTHQLIDAEAGELGSQGAGVKPRDIEQRAENFL